MMINELVIRRPDDWHLHLRDGSMLKTVTPLSSRHFSRAIIMPNIVPPVTTLDEAKDYNQRILETIPESHDFEPLMTLYLTETTSKEEIIKCAKSGLVKAVKLYPAGATTNSESGVHNIENVIPVLEQMAESGLPLCVHGEVTSSDIDIFDREDVFINTILEPLRRKIPELRIVLEHVTTASGVDYVMSSTKNLAATITPQHLIINRNFILAGGIRPHYYCLPIAKRENDRLAIRKAAVSGDKRFFFGSDSAPHVDKAKESACGCAGILNSVNALGCLATVFEQEERLDNLEKFVSLNGAAFYKLPPNSSKVTLCKKGYPVVVPKKIQTDDGPVTVFDPGFSIYWHTMD